jgi:hypothetical protein
VLQKNPSNSATIGVATGTSTLSIIDNAAVPHRRPSPEPQLTVDPLHPPRQHAHLIHDDDDARPLDPLLIRRLQLKGTASAFISR